MAETILITGASRGIGLALVEAACGRGDTVFATCRRPDEAEGLQRLADGDNPPQVLALDVTSEESVSAAAERARSATDRLDVLINNAGVSPAGFGNGLQKLDFATFHEAVEVNTVGPLRVARALLGLLERSDRARVANVSSGAGRISTKDTAKGYAYGASKAAQNFVTRAMAAELSDRGIVVVAMSPGYVRTDMAGPNADIAPEESAAGILACIDSLTADDNGRWVNYQSQRFEQW
jgi:NAD(P)-dependent dehydrogenase (short-subunit alcohol dehydrogenase family)